MRELHLFAGAGGGILGGILIGHRCVCAVEIEPYRRACLLQRQRDGLLPWFPIWDDVRTFDGEPWCVSVDVLAAGWPCTGISTAGKMLGLECPESGLWSEVARLVGEVEPSYVFLENTPAITILGLHRVVGDLAQMGYDCRWCVLGGADANMDTDGPRFWLLAKATGKGWPRILQNQSGISNSKNESSRTSNNAYPPTLAQRVHKHELRCGEPAILGELDGLANRVDRLEAIGSGQIPAVVKLAWETLSQ